MTEEDHQAEDVINDETVIHILNFWKNIDGDKLVKTFSHPDADLIGRLKQ